MDRSLLDGRLGGPQNLAEEIAKSQRQTPLPKGSLRNSFLYGGTRFWEPGKTFTSSACEYAISFVTCNFGTAHLCNTGKRNLEKPVTSQ